MDDNGTAARPAGSANATTLRQRLPSLPGAGAAPEPPVIDQITVEKSEVCEGEENLVSVRAHTPDGNDAYLHYQIGATRGDPAAVHSFLDDRGNPTTHMITVFSRNNIATTVPVPAFRVKTCADLPVAVITFRLLPNSWADFQFEGKVVPSVLGSSASSGAAATFRPRSFRWSFGDAVTEESGSSVITHSFSERPQDTLYSRFTVTLEIAGADGRIARARQALELRNPAFEALDTKHIVQLMVELEPRFPTMSAAGTVEQNVRIWHVRPDPVQITRVTLLRRQMQMQMQMQMQTDEGSGAAQASPEHPPVASVLGAAAIPPGRGVTARLVLDSRAEPRTISHDYTLEGRTSDGLAVRGAFSVMRPPEPPTRAQHQAIADPILVAKIKRARELLHREFVTDEDLWALDRAGQFAGLQGDGPVPAARPSAATGR